MSNLGQTVRITTLSLGEELESNDEVVFVDKSDTSGSVDGTDKKMRIREFIETAPLRPSSAEEIERPLSEWIGEFKDSIDSLQGKTEKATSNRFGVTRYATTEEAQNKTEDSRAITPANLGNLDSSESLAGLIAIASALEVSDGQVDNKAVTPATLFESILGDAVLGSNEWVFKLPTRNVVGDVKTELVIQFGQREFSTMQTELNPTSNFNHIHQRVEFDVTFPQPFPNTTLMVIPIGFEATPSEYTEGSNFWIRPFDIRNSGATLRASRINGVSDGSEIGAVRYLAIGY